VEWDYRTAEINDDSGKVFFQQKDVEVPKFWSELATKVVVSKYFYGENGTEEREKSVRQLIHRVCRTIADWGVKDGYFGKADGEVFYDELSWLCLNQYGSFNSPVWFNVGLYQQYGVGKNSAQGNWVYDHGTKTIRRAQTQYENPQCSACFIQSVEDNMESIMNLACSEAMLFKFGSGTGSDLTPIRSSREKLSGGGRPSGPMSFLKVYDQVANVVKSGGKTRRAAKMNTLYDWHGDIEEFIEAKQIEEKKVWALIAQGYDGSFNGPAYGSAMYQNENLSVRATDEFMNAAIEGLDWKTRAVNGGEILETKNASHLLYKIAEGTWICGDPGIQFDTAIQKWNTCKGSDIIRSSNPCSEYLFLNDTACNLSSLNLMKFKDESGKFDVERLKAAARIFITAQEIVVDNSSYPTRQIAANSHIFRALGLGFANLGSLIMSYGLPYDSNEGRALAGAITSIMTASAYEQSAKMSSIMGPFPGYTDSTYLSSNQPRAPHNIDSMMEVIRLHRAAVEDIAPNKDFSYLKDEARSAWQNVIALGEKHGFRNAQTTVLAPTGTISFMMDCDTTGVEPDIALVKYKLLVGGGMLKMANRTVSEALSRLGYQKDLIAKITAHIEKYDTVEDVQDDSGEIVTSGLKPEHLAVFDCAFRPQNGKRSILPMGHLRMMAAVQPFISGAISKTVNMPNESTVEQIKDTYIQAWKMGLKCVAIYRDGSKSSQPLNTGKKGTQIETGLLDSETLLARVAELEETVKKLEERADRPVRKRLPFTRNAVNHKFEIAGHEGYLTVGLYENEQPGELFITMAKEGSTIGGLMDCIATLTSIALQYGVPLEDLVRKFSHQRFEPWGLTGNPQIRSASSIIDYIFRWIALRFIPEYRAQHLSSVEQQGLALPGIQEELKKAANRSVPDLPLKDADGNHPENSKSLNSLISHFQKDAPLCPCCGHITVRNGACYKCLNCGESLGCS
jgi:ribonucleoside-diphosphate reductase alpha chain